MAGLVWRGDNRLEKPGLKLDPETRLEVRGRPHPWVSRGGVKLAHALDQFVIHPANMTALDVGASTGGFTDVLLNRDAARIYAVDVGHGQLAWKLRNDPRVVVLEGVNARFLSRAEVPQGVDLIVCDVSFIGLTKVLPAVLALAHPGARLVALVKPQFEAGRDQVGKGGVVRDPAVHRAVCARVEAWIQGRPGWRVSGISQSPIAGANGNVEFFIAAHRDDTSPE